ncbi:hypothetical protein FH608_036155 [Nonomuraea phyllanthi]|uniref:Uncharacterized protein n=1 Tax=Nonomuraea phyllanthi TaxID=2219224 RepID=A0A5C4VX74_9ACTN|nr:hypothetical protein [Nonomuraea phyllanthi]KAB8190388.1 hypothetical protein FH608_036155 [Nonomuraea phyllanthi]QFY05648.1 hypothetical protein GBF35_02215 [Nonomuraea phyllanthi]
MSRQMTFTLACVVVLSALVPGVAGYLSARMEAIEAAERNLHALEARLHLREAREARPVSFPAPCLRTPATPRFQQVPATALGEYGKRWPAWVTGLLKEVADFERDYDY